MKIKIMDVGEIQPGDLFQVTDRERKKFTLKYETIDPKYVHLKQMGRGSTRTVKLEHDIVNLWIQNNYRNVEKIQKY